MTTSLNSRLSEQEALAVTKALMQGRESDAFLMVSGSENPKTLALLACGLAAAALKHGTLDGARWLDLRQQSVAAEEI